MTDFRPGRFQILPTVVKNLIIINTIMVLVQYVLGNKFGIDLADYLGLHYWKSSLFKPWQLLTHMFMHGSYNNVNMTITHLLSNMFALWMFGSVLENVWGPKRFITFYVICGLGAALLHLGVVGYEFQVINNAFEAYQQTPTLDQYDLLLKQRFPQPITSQGQLDLYRLLQEWSNTPSSIGFSEASKEKISHYISGYNDQQTHMYIKGLFDEATVGASGAVFGILFAFGYLFPNTLLYLYFLVPIKAKWVVAGYALVELYTGIQNSAGDNVAHFAHLGGMLVGFIILKIWSKQNRRDFF